MREGDERMKKGSIPRVFSAADDLDNDNEDDEKRVLERYVTYHAERCTAGEQTRQRQALGVLLGYEKMAG